MSFAQMKKQLFAEETVARSNDPFPFDDDGDDDDDDEERYR